MDNIKAVAEIELKITKDSLDNLTWGDWEILQDGDISYKDARRLAALFMVDGFGNQIPFDEAMETLKQLRTSQIREVASNLTSRITGATKEFVPNAKGLD